MTVRGRIRAVIAPLYRRCTVQSLHIRKAETTFSAWEHLLPAADCGKEKRVWPLICNCSCVHYNMWQRNLSIKPPFRAVFCLNTALEGARCASLQVYACRAFTIIVSARKPRLFLTHHPWFLIYNLPIINRNCRYITLYKSLQILRK